MEKLGPEQKIRSKCAPDQARSANGIDRRRALSELRKTSGKSAEFLRDFAVSGAWGTLSAEAGQEHGTGPSILLLPSGKPQLSKVRLTLRHDRAVLNMSGPNVRRNYDPRSNKFLSPQRSANPAQNGRSLAGNASTRKLLKRMARLEGPEPRSTEIRSVRLARNRLSHCPPNENKGIQRKYRFAIRTRGRMVSSQLFPTVPKCFPTALDKHRRSLIQ